MVKLDKRSITYLSVAVAALLAIAVAVLFFAGPVGHLSADVKRLSRQVQEERSLVAQKPLLEEEWRKRKIASDVGQDADALSNSWVKNLLVMAQSQSLALEKLEPAGIKTGPAGKTVSVFISFQGDIRQFVGFLYRLADEDPLSQVEFFSMRQEEMPGNFFFELTLAKAAR